MLVQIHTGLITRGRETVAKNEKVQETAAFEISQEYLTLILGKRQRRSSAIF